MALARLDHIGWFVLGLAGPEEASHTQLDACLLLPIPSPYELYVQLHLCLYEVPRLNVVRLSLSNGFVRLLDVDVNKLGDDPFVLDGRELPEGILNIRNGFFAFSGLNMSYEDRTVTEYFIAYLGEDHTL